MISKHFNRAVFLEKDGAVLRNMPHNVEPRFLSYAENIIPACRQLLNSGFKLVIVTHQPGLAKGLFHEYDLLNIFHYMDSFLSKNQITISGYYYCPHHPRGRVECLSLPCLCRRPMPGLLFQAAKELDLSLTHSWMIGDSLDSIEAGTRAGGRGALLNNGVEQEWRINTQRMPELVSSDLLVLAKNIIERQKSIFL